MRMLRDLLFVVAAMSIIVLSGKALGAECYHNAPAVRAANPGAWPSWSQRLPGHAGQRCWFPSERKVVHANLMRAGKHTPPSYTTMPTSTPAPSASVGVPLPRAVPFDLTKEKALEALIPFNERWAALGLSWR